jgi:hypothetical protein
MNAIQALSVINDTSKALLKLLTLAHDYAPDDDINCLIVCDLDDILRDFWEKLPEEFKAEHEDIEELVNNLFWHIYEERLTPRADEAAMEEGALKRGILESLMNDVSTIRLWASENYLSVRRFERRWIS